MDVASTRTVPIPNPQSRCRPLCVNPRAVRIKGGPLSISSTYNSLTLCEDFVRIVLVGRFSLELFQLTRAMRSAIDRRFGKPGEEGGVAVALVLGDA